MTRRSVSPQTPPPSRRNKERLRITKSGIDKVASSITERDKRICLDIYEHRFLTTPQSSRLHFGSYPRARDRLFKLYRMRVLDRFRPRRGTGSYPWHYVLDEIGIAIVSAYLGVEPKDLRYDKEKALAQVFSPRLLHASQVNDFFTNLAKALKEEGLRLGSWLGERGCALFWKGMIRPDGYGRIERTGRTVSFFLELDGGTEDLSRLARKLDRYATVAGLPEAAHTLLFCFQTPARERSARRVLYDCGLAVATAAFPEHMQDPLASIWLPIGGSRRKAITEFAANGRGKLVA